MSAMSDELLKGLEKHDMITPSPVDITADTDWWGIKFTKAIYEFSATGTTSVHFSPIDIAMVLLLFGAVGIIGYFLIKFIAKKKYSPQDNLPPSEANKPIKNKLANNKAAVILSIMLIGLFTYSYQQDQEIKHLKQEVNYQKWRVETEKNLTAKAEEKCDELSKKLDEAQTPVQVVYSAPQIDSFTQYQQDQAYTDMLNKINRNLDQQYFNSITGDY